MLDRMHACAGNSASSALDAATGSDSDSITGGVPVPAGSSERGNDEWGTGRGEAGIVQAYNYVIRTCGKAGGSEMALDLIQQMHTRCGRKRRRREVPDPKCSDHVSIPGCCAK